MNCERAYQEIQDVARQQEEMRASRGEMLSIASEGESELERWINSARARAEKAREGIEAESKPAGADGEVINYPLAKRQAELLGRDAIDDISNQIGLTQGWEKLDPKTYKEYRTVDSRTTFAERMAKAFQQAGVDIRNDEIMKAVQRNAAPFIGILDNQAQLRASSDILRVDTMQKLQDIIDQIEETGRAPTKSKVSAFLTSNTRAVYAWQNLQLAKTRSGQLLQNWSRLVTEDMADPGSLFQTNAREALEESQQMVNDLQTNPDGTPKTPAEMVDSSEVTGAVIKAAIEGPKGVETLKEIQKTLDLELKNPKGPGPGDKGWESVWKRAASAAYKDSLLFSAGTQFKANYLSQKIVFAAEGTKALLGSENFYKLREIREAQGELFEPTGTKFTRSVKQDLLDGARITVRSNLIAEQVISAAYKQETRLGTFLASKKAAMREGFFDSNTPFAAQADNFTSRGRDDGQTIDRQYEVAQAVLGAPFSRNPAAWPLELSDKVMWGTKLLANKAIEKAGVRLPVTSALQMMSAVDQRQGLRIFYTERATQMLLDQAKRNPTGTYKDWEDAVVKTLDQEIYSNAPSPAQIKSARKQFNVPKEISDEQIEAWIVAEKQGLPLLDTPGRKDAFMRSINLRMQGSTGPAAVRKFGNAVQSLRSDNSLVGRYTDRIISFWRSPYEQAVWDVSLALTPANGLIKTVQRLNDLRTGRKPTAKEMAETQAAVVTSLALFGSFMALDETGQIVGSCPLEPKARRQCYERLEAEGKSPNSIFGIPMNLGGIPVLNTLFLYKDLRNVIRHGQVSDYDKAQSATGLLAVMSNVILRQGGFRQVEMLINAFSEGNEAAFQRLRGLMLNASFNPTSGVMRDIENTFNLGRYDLYPPSPGRSGDQAYLIDQLGPDHPLNDAWAKLRQLTYDSTPAAAYFLDFAEKKDVTFLDRPRNVPSPLFNPEWPVGEQGSLPFDKGEFMVERTLERMGLLNPPNAVRTFELQGTPITPDLAKEYNSYVGKVKSTDGFGRDEQSDAGFIYSFTGSLPREGDYPREDIRFGEDATDLLYEVTKGKNQREALNALFNHPKWKKMQATPGLTNDLTVEDMTPRMQMARPTSKIVARIQKYYADLALEKVWLSNSPDAAQWREDQGLLMVSPDAAEAQADGLRSILR